MFLRDNLLYESYSEPFSFLTKTSAYDTFFEKLNPRLMNESSVFLVFIRRSLFVSF
jgi:hypothetical protein